MKSKLIEMLCVGSGCAIGAILRYLTQLAIAPHTYDDMAILIVNVLGCAILGFATAIVTQRHSSPYLKKFLTTGFCGGLTTFSTFSGDNIAMLQTNPGLALAFIAGNMILGLLAYTLASSIRIGKR